MRTSIRQRIFQGLALVCLGFLAGKLVFIPGVYVDKGINPLHAISILVTLYLGVVVALIIKRRDSAKMIRMELAIERLKDIDVYLVELDGKIECGKCKYLSLASFQKRILTTAQVIREQYPKSHSTLSLTFDDLTENVRELHTIFTSNDVNPDKDDIKVIDGDAIFPSARISAASAKIHAIRNAVYQVMFELSKV